MTAAFTGRVRRTPVSILYQAALLLVSGAMVLLPLVYVALIGVASWAVYSWAVHFKFLAGSVQGGARFYVVKLLFYLSPLFVGAVLVFFMIKPLFARRAPRAQPLALSPGAEPVLFAFIARVCEIVGAPFPKRIDLDCHFNAAAGFRRGASSFLSNDLVLTIGLPLVAALNLREFAGVLAHEFGHFTQSFGMRLSYLIRNINGWFARLVYQRDTWDLWLEELAETEEWWTAIIVGFARLAVWFSRMLLCGLMFLGHAISCFMMRQMEYDADSYEIKLAGSEAFETTTRRMHLFGKALDLAYKNMRVSWNLNRNLPENFPAYLLLTEANLPPGKRQKLEDTMGLAPTGWFDTHPSKGDRIRRARQAAEAGVFHLDGPASALFTAFEIPAKQVTLLHYSDDLGIDTMAARLVPVKSAHGVGDEAQPADEPHGKPPVPGIRFKVRSTPPA
ncbi:MAG TPA: M48 family metalloprotease [Verrucomicrobiae bacterium]|nr:M48 family metalloprotease [Verrucomicrobiae bacterium]